MKNIICYILFILFSFISFSSYALTTSDLETCLASTTHTTGEKVLGGYGIFYGISVTTDGTNNVVITVYDNTVGSGNTIIDTWTVTASTSNLTQVYGFTPGVAYKNGIYVTATTAGTVSYKVFYKRD